MLIEILATGKSQRWAGDQIGLHQSRISQILKADDLPSMKYQTGKKLIALHKRICAPTKAGEGRS